MVYFFKIRDPLASGCKFLKFREAVGFKLGGGFMFFSSFHPDLGKWSQLMSIFLRWSGKKAPTSKLQFLFWRQFHGGVQKPWPLPFNAVAWETTIWSIEGIFLFPEKNACEDPIGAPNPGLTDCRKHDDLHGSLHRRPHPCWVGRSWRSFFYRVYKRRRHFRLGMNLLQVEADI